MKTDERSRTLWKPPATAGAEAAVEGLTVEVNRRNFLKGTLAGSILLAGSGLLPAGCARYEAPGAELKVFSEKEYAVMKAAADALVGHGGEGAPSATEAGVAAQFDAQLAFAPEEVRTQVKQMLQIFEHGTQVFFFSIKRFTELSPEQQDSYIETWMESGIAFRKTVFTAMRRISFAIYYATPAVWSSIDYDGPWIGQTAIGGRGWAEKQLRNF
ncbi:MAG: gluconate 2-dehydrogenase subunit 3 family protein [Deltaproteobacteria bacterium]|nr:gluconate 2-dehydrogenase subunit 3 family protein [Deltaproteobacteria bacterium]